MKKRKQGLTLAQCIGLGVCTLAVAVAAVTVSPSEDKGRRAKSGASQAAPGASAGGSEPVPGAGATAAPSQTPGTMAANGAVSDKAGVVDVEPPPPTGPITVTVTGAVKQPGTFTMQGGARVYQAVRRAGGLIPNAAADELNLTQILRDGHKINVPLRATETVVPPPTAAPPSTGSIQNTSPAESRETTPPGTSAPSERIVITPPASAPAMNNAPVRATPSASETPSATPRQGGGVAVNINTATFVELQRLPGVGPALAERILAYRKEVGKFRSPEQILDVRGVTEEKFAAMESLLRVQ